MASGKEPLAAVARVRRAPTGGGMNSQPAILAKVDHARRTETVLQWLGWLVAVLGIAGMITFTVFWVLGDLTAEQGVGLVLGTTLATVLSGATVYASGVNIGLGAERLRLAARADHDQAE